MVNAARIDQALKQLAYNRYFRINAHQVAYLSGHTNMDEVYSYMVSREPYIMKRSYEVLCPERMDAAAAYASLEDIPEHYIECRICGEEFIPDKDMIQIFFYFTEEYIESVKLEISNEKKYKRPLMSIY